MPNDCVIEIGSRPSLTPPEKPAPPPRPTVQNGFRTQKESIIAGLRRKSPTKEIPFRFLYNEEGSAIYEEITKLEEYYPYQAEVELLDEHAANIATYIPYGSVVVELGCGSAKKTSKLLKAVMARHGRYQYVGIDVSESFLNEAQGNLMSLVPGQDLCVDFIQGDYLEGVRQARAKYPKDPFCLLWLGSSVGNLTASAAISFFKELLDAAGNKCRLFLCTDMWKKAAKLYVAYHDKEGLTEKFIRNGMRNAMQIMGYCLPSDSMDSWIYEVEINLELQQVEMYLKFQEGLNLPRHPDISVRPGERVLMEISRKFTIAGIQCMSQASGFHELSAWRNGKYDGQMLLSDVEALKQCWQENDTLFQGFSDWSFKSINVRHPYCFYYGHLASFMKLKLFPEEHATDMDHMFSRGIDPAVLDPSQCHDHPEIPTEWPAREEIVAYVKCVREKVLDALSMKTIPPRLITFTCEHDRMHQETLAYMMVQERKLKFENSAAAATTRQCLQPNGATTSLKPPTAMSIAQSFHKSKMVRIEAGTVVLGTDASKSGFLWDNEYPQCQSIVSTSFFVSIDPVSIGEFYRFVLECGYEKQNLWDSEDFKYIQEKGVKFPATWSCVSGEIYVHEPHETNHWSKVAYHPVFVSLSEADAFCRWVDRRIMTEAEYQRILDVICDDDGEKEKVKQMRNGGWEWTSTLFEPFPGFQAMPEYPEYSTDFFDGKHFVLKGTSPVTHPSMRRDSFRNFYQRQYPYAFAKFRCCQ